MTILSKCEQCEHVYPSDLDACTKCKTLNAYLSHTYGMSGRKFSQMSTRRKRVWFKEKSRLRRLASRKV